MEYGYIRHSPSLPKNDNQLLGLNLPQEAIYVDICSIKDHERPARKRLLQDVSNGDIIHIQSMDRIAKNVRDMLTFLTDVLKKNVTLHFIKENLTIAFSVDPKAAETILTTLHLLTIWERTLLRELQEEGKAAARQAGKRFGRPTNVTEAQRKEVRRLLLEDNSKSVLQISRETGVPRTTCYRIKDMLDKELAGDEPTPLESQAAQEGTRYTSPRRHGKILQFKSKSRRSS